MKMNNYLIFSSYERYKIDECINVSSRCRNQRANQLSPPNVVNDLIDIASDTGDEKHPIFRSVREDDPCELKTIAVGKYFSNF